MSAEPGDAPDPDQVETLSDLLRIGKDEMNLAEFPMTSLSDRPIAGATSLKFEDQIYDNRKKRLIVRKRIIEGSQEYGLPTATDDAVILALIQLTRLKNGFASRDVEFTRHELIKLLRWPHTGQSYERIAQSLHRVAAVTYHFENSWWDNRRKAWTTKIFGIIDTVELNDGRDGDGQAGLFPSRIQWNQVVFDSFQAGYLRSLDFQLAIGLKHAISMRIYRFMGKRFHLRPEWSFDLKDFAYEHIGLSRKYEGGTQIARKLQPALTELENVGFLRPLAAGERFVKKGREWTIRLIQNPPALAVAPEAPPAREADTPLVAALTSRGVTGATAAELVPRHPAETIQAKIEVFDWLVERRDKRVEKSPAGYLVQSIAKEYAPPKGFLPRAERRRREEARQAGERQAEEERRRQRGDDARQREEQAAAEAYWASLSPARQKRLEAEALADGGDEARRTHETMKRFRGGSGYLALLRRDYIIKRMRDGGLSPAKP